LKYLRSATVGFKDIGIRKSEFVAKTQFLFICFKVLSNMVITTLVFYLRHVS